MNRCGKTVFVSASAGRSPACSAPTGPITRGGALTLAALRPAQRRSGQAYGPLRRRRYQAGVLGQCPARVLRDRCLPPAKTPPYLLLAQLHLYLPLGDIDRYRVAFFDDRDWPAERRFGRDVPGREPAGRS